MKDFLLEIGTEEIPARMMRKAANDLKESLSQALQKAQLNCASISCSAAPRQLVVTCHELQEHQEDREELVLGPPVRIAYRDGEPSPALLGFLRKNPDLQPEDLFHENQPKGDVVAAKRFIAGESAATVLGRIIPTSLGELHFAKNMRWGDRDTLFVRPVRSILALLGDQVVDFEFAGVGSGRMSFGHRFHGQRSFEVGSVAVYSELKQRNHIWVDHDARKKDIAAQIERHLTEIEGVLVPDDRLLEEVADLVECPFVVRGRFHPDFLEIPREVLISSLREHQKSFCVQDANGAMMPFFLSLASVPHDQKGLIAKGNEWVLRARLWDAKFFWESDCVKDLESMRAKLTHLMFQTELGSYLQKAERLEAGVKVMTLGLSLSEREVGDIVKAARHAKTDLMSELVFEFPELQGVVGGLLLRHQKQHHVTWKGVYEHYLPAAVDDDLPETTAGLLISLCDKLDTLVGCFSVGLIPTGTKDPYALRRAAQGVVRILMECELPLDLNDLIANSCAAYGVDSAVADQVAAFMADRVKYLLKRRGFTHDLVDAVMAGGYARVDRCLMRAEAIAAQQHHPSFRSLALNLKRMQNVIADELEWLGDFDLALLKDDAERVLWREFTRLRPEIEAACAETNYNRAMDLMTELADPVDVYFSPGGVFVNVDDEGLRRNRKSMMHAMLGTLSLLGDLAQLDAK